MTTPRRPARRRRGRDAGQPARRAHDRPSPPRRTSRPSRSSTATSGSVATIGRFRAIFSWRGIRLSGLPGVGRVGRSCTSRSSTGSPAASPRSCAGSGGWSDGRGSSALFSVGHTGGDLWRARRSCDQFQPEAVSGVAPESDDVVRQVVTRAPPRTRWCCTVACTIVGRDHAARSRSAALAKPTARGAGRGDVARRRRVPAGERCRRARGQSKSSAGNTCHKPKATELTATAVIVECRRRSNPKQCAAEDQFFTERRSERDAHRGFVARRRGDSAAPEGRRTAVLSAGTARGLHDARRRLGLPPRRRREPPARAWPAPTRGRSGPRPAAARPPHCDAGHQVAGHVQPGRQHAVEHRAVARRRRRPPRTRATPLFVVRSSSAILSGGPDVKRGNARSASEPSSLAFSSRPANVPLTFQRTLMPRNTDGPGVGHRPVGLDQPGARDDAARGDPGERARRVTPHLGRNVSERRGAAAAIAADVAASVPACSSSASSRQRHREPLRRGGAYQRILAVDRRDSRAGSSAAAEERWATRPTAQRRSLVARAARPRLWRAGSRRRAGAASDRTPACPTTTPRRRRPRRSCSVSASRPGHRASPRSTRHGQPHRADGAHADSGADPAIVRPDRRTRSRSARSRAGGGYAGRRCSRRSRAKQEAVETAFDIRPPSPT